MDTIAMDTYPLIAKVTGAATDVVTQQDPALRRAWEKVTLVPGGFAARGGQANDGEKSSLAPYLRTPIRRAITVIIARRMGVRK